MLVRVTVHSQNNSLRRPFNQLITLNEAWWEWHGMLSTFRALYDLVGWCKDVLSGSLTVFLIDYI